MHQPDFDSRLPEEDDETEDMMVGAQQSYAGGG